MRTSSLVVVSMTWVGIGAGVVRPAGPGAAGGASPRAAPEQRRRTAARPSPHHLRRCDKGKPLRRWIIGNSRLRRGASGPGARVDLFVGGRRAIPGKILVHGAPLQGEPGGGV